MKNAVCSGSGFFQKPHGVTSQKTAFFKIVITLRKLRTGLIPEDHETVGFRIFCLLVSHLEAWKASVLVRCKCKIASGFVLG
jgi:hypothetical protein